MVWGAKEDLHRGEWREGMGHGKVRANVRSNKPKMGDEGGLGRKYKY